VGRHRLCTTPPREQGGGISGDWGRQPDTVIQLERDGDNPRSKITWQKVRYSSEVGSRPKKQLLEWVPEHKGFNVCDIDLSGAVSDEELYRRLDEFLADHPNAKTKDVKTNVTGADDRLVEVLKKGETVGRYAMQLGNHGAHLWSLREAGVRAPETHTTHTTLFEGENPHE